MMFKDLQSRISRPEPACNRTGYWVAGAGMILTLALGFGSFAFPQVRGSVFWKIPPCLILAGLALEGVEATLAVSATQRAANKKEVK